MDDKFKSFLELNRVFSQSKKDIHKVIDIILPTASKDLKTLINQLLKEDNLEQLYNHISEDMQDMFDEKFTEKELSELIDIFSLPVMVKWLDFYDSAKANIEESSSNWIYKNCKSK